jgi:serine/threonine protein phosphatase PrpC
MLCPACSTEVPVGSDNRFCEECGAALASSAAKPDGCVCGASVDERDEEGFCLRCGRKFRIPLPADHMEEAPTPGFAAVSDRGLRHDRNEDRFGIFSTQRRHAMVVCDGVSSSQHSEIASAAVSAGVLQFLSNALAGGPLAQPEEIVRRAIAAGSAHLEASSRVDTNRLSVSRKMRRPDENPASTTVVAALVADGVMTVGWVGDSRAYWIDETAAWPLTQDHSWFNDAVKDGDMTPEQAAKSPNAHAITRWIGADADVSEAEVVSRPINALGTLVLCTDGLWNYAPVTKDFAELVHASATPGKDALGRARELVQFALDRGGHDNITVALLEIAADTVRTREQ